MRFKELTKDALSHFLPFDPEICGVYSDSELCKSGGLFIAISGFHGDGHGHIGEALANGAAAAVISSDRKETARELESLGIPYAVYDDTRAAEAFITSLFYGSPEKRLKIIAVTGTNGKTTTVNLLYSVFTTAGFKCRMIGTLTGKLTTPDPSELYPTLREFADNGTEYVFMEASSHALSLGKLAPIEFEYGVFTNLTPEHLDFHGSMEEYEKAKAKLFRASKTSVINADDTASYKMSEAAQGRVITCSAKAKGADFFAENIRQNGIHGISYDLMTKNRVFKIKTSMSGLFTVMNTLEAAAVSLSEGIPPEVIRGAICGFSGVSGRLERIIIPTNDFSVYIDFAHTPDALENILKTVRNFMSPDKRLVLLFGCGGDRDKTKRPVMGGIATALADFVIITSDNSRSEDTAEIINDILSGVSSNGTYTVIESRKEAIEYAIENARYGDVILLAGKGHEQYEITRSGTRPFSERDIVFAASQKYIKSRGMF